MKKLFLVLALAFCFAQIHAQTVTQMVICANVENLQPQIPKYQFNKGETVYCWLMIEGATPGSPLLFEWYLGDQLMRQQSVTLDYERMRVYSSKDLLQDGNWKVIVRGPAGNPLRAMAFSVGKATTGGSTTAISDPKG